ncbi:MAG: glycosyltransferase family 2 protein [Sulfuricurvum sp.]|uniref:glycosyltransferase family 2 protein n=1 Tax=Sulfuricurvum sp. TaxID=2025608 RepID=UPI002630B6FB|nr:glycosyltransferase family 2 protein [Sulfuricurvum sp.]MDD2828059.1 glycosyltransferase family 2 protein [Sulfuricurvum sp.]MDD4948064.1 glycosyltransferase family 2 protein [Sulfuricurvum sp.]
MTHKRLILPCNSDSIVWIIVLNYNNSYDTIECAESVLKNGYQNFQLLLIDNASTDNSLHEICLWAESYGYLLINESDSKQSSNKITIINNNQNYGFAGGNATGVRYALNNSADYVLLLNNDTIVEPKFIEPLLNVYHYEEKAGIVGGIIRYADEPNRIWFSGGKIGWYREAIHSTDLFSNPYRESPFISGCLMMIPTTLIQKFGFMDERFFLYVEDSDYCTTLRENGYQNFVARESIIYHKIGRSTGGDFAPFSYYYGTRNRLLYHYKHKKKIGFFFFLTFFIGIKFIRTLLFSIQGRIATRDAMFRGVRDFFRLIGS